MLHHLFHQNQYNSILLKLSFQDLKFLLPIIADATYQKEMVYSAFKSSLAETDDNFYEESDFLSQNEFDHQSTLYRLKALIWQTAPEIRKAYYIVK